MAEGKLEARDFDQWITLAEKASREAVFVANDAFTAAMNKQIKRGREKARPGTYVDRTASIGAVRIHGDVIWSPCGSPAQMCVERAVAEAGAETLK